MIKPCNYDSSITVKIPKKDRSEFRLALLKKGKTVREVLPQLIREWTAKNGGSK